MSETDLPSLLARVRTCAHCADLPHGPRPIVQAGGGARVVIVGQAPGSKVHMSGVPWDDDSGDRLRGWTGLPREVFYDPERIALVPMGLCYPGKGDGGDLPPRRECAPLWHAALMARMPKVRLVLLVGQYAQGAYWPRHLRKSMTEAVRNHDLGPGNLFPLPHPAWRSRLWMAKHPWFETEVLPVLREKVQAALET